VSVSALISASGAGREGVSELEQQTAGLLASRELEPTHFPHRLGFNLIPQVGPFSEGSGSTLEELSWRAETGLLWGRSAPALDGTAVWVPTFHGTLVLMQVRLGKGMTPAEARQLLEDAPGLKLLDAPGDRVYPMPMLVTADDAIHVGRIRAFAGQRRRAGAGRGHRQRGWPLARLCLEVGRARHAGACDKLTRGPACTCRVDRWREDFRRGAGRDKLARPCYPSGGCPHPSGGLVLLVLRARPWPRSAFSQLPARGPTRQLPFNQGDCNRNEATA
jgi:hypothetical protein